MDLERFKKYCCQKPPHPDPLPLGGGEGEATAVVVDLCVGGFVTPSLVQLQY